MTANLYQNKAGWSFQFPASQKKLPDILQGIEENDWQTANMSRTSIQISYFTEKYANTLGQ